MDAAETPNLLAAQGARLGEHAQILTTLTARVQRLESQELATGEPEAGAVGIPSSLEAYICDPEAFAGDLEKCRGFLLQCRLVFAHRQFLSRCDPSQLYCGVIERGALACAQAATSRQPLHFWKLEEFTLCQGSCKWRSMGVWNAG